MEGIVINEVLDKTKKLIKTNVKSKEWRRLFSETGHFLAENSNAGEAFKQDLSGVFSEENIFMPAYYMSRANI